MRWRFLTYIYVVEIPDVFLGVEIPNLFSGVEISVIFSGVEIPHVPVCAPEHGAHRLQHAGAAGGGAATRDVPTRARGNTQVSCQQTLRSDHQLKG